MDSWNKDESILREHIAELERQQEKMMKCTTCPHDVGDASERDCCFPDCSGGWEAVYFDERNDRVRKDAEIERLRAILDKIIGEVDMGDAFVAEALEVLEQTE